MRKCGTLRRRGEKIIRRDGKTRNCEIDHRDSLVGIYSAPRRILMTAGNQISRRKERNFARNSFKEKKGREGERKKITTPNSVLMINVRYKERARIFTAQRNAFVSPFSFSPFPLPPSPSSPPSRCSSPRTNDRPSLKKEAKEKRHFHEGETQCVSLVIRARTAARRLLPLRKQSDLLARCRIASSFSASLPGKTPGE